jgi:putative Mg2+ transporter-C (MgtC) family protein
VFANILTLTLAFIIALPIGWERGKQYNIAGLRTFSIVSVASCGYALVAKDFPDINADAVSRVIQGLVAGIGFVGGGAIVRDRGSVQGVATAASIWNTGAIGVGMAYGREDIALALGFINFLALLVLTPWANRLHRPPNDA